MERLTERNKNGCAMAACWGGSWEYNYCCEVGGFSECDGIDDIIDRLAAIEDIAIMQQKYQCLYDTHKLSKKPCVNCASHFETNTD